jgi:hypothetical protein
MLRRKYPATIMYDIKKTTASHSPSAKVDEY